MYLFIPDSFHFATFPLACQLNLSTRTLVISHVSPHEIHVHVYYQVCVVEMIHCS